MLSGYAVSRLQLRAKSARNAPKAGHTASASSLAFVEVSLGDGWLLLISIEESGNSRSLASSQSPPSSTDGCGERLPRWRR
jgi:hypothetical protein